MFRIVFDPSSGITELCLIEITLSGSQIFFVCLVGVWQRVHRRCLVRRAWNQFPGRRTVHKHRRFKITLPNTDQEHEKYLWTTKSNFSQAQIGTPHRRFKMTLPDTDQAREKYLWTTTSNFSQAQLSTPHRRFKITLPNTDQAHEKYLWTTKSNFSQAQLTTPWWWIAHDPKPVGVILNCVLKLTQRRF